MPVLKLRYRLILYILTIIFIILSLIQVVYERFGYVLGILVYVLAAVTLFASCYYLVLALRYGVREKVKA